MTKKKKGKSFVLIDIGATTMTIAQSTIIYSNNIKKYIKFIESYSTSDEPTGVFVTDEGHLYTQLGSGEVLYYNGDELEAWRKTKK